MTVTNALAEALDTFDEAAQGRIVRILRLHALRANTHGQRVWRLALASFADERGERSSAALVAAAADLAPSARQSESFIFESLGVVAPGDVLHGITSAVLGLLLVTELPIDARQLDKLRDSNVQATALPATFLGRDGEVVARSIIVDG